LSKGLLYIMTGLVFTAQNLPLWMDAFAGASLSKGQNFSLGAGVALLLAGLLRLRKRSAGALLATVALVLLWCFYLPPVLEATHAYERWSAEWLRPLTIFVLLFVSSVVAFHEAGVLMLRFLRSDPTKESR
jgi:hypothetical protein